MTTTFARSTAAAGLPAVRVFVLETKGAAILAFEAKALREAMELGRETWLREDLARLTSNHAPLWDPKAPIRARSATPEEAETYRRGVADNQDDSDLRIVYLAQLDRIPIAQAPVPRGAFPPRR